jgi:hypothetical protein
MLDATIYELIELVARKQWTMIALQAPEPITAGLACSGL